tara:strand:+ start:611 stop:802 length:192 start_codon:yes stop_codon:yes gene_type:complete
MIPILFVAPDGEDEPTLWRATRGPDLPAAVLRRCDLPSEHRDLWEHIAGSVAVRSFGPEGADQ